MQATRRKTYAETLAKLDANAMQQQALQLLAIMEVRVTLDPCTALFDRRAYWASAPYARPLTTGLYFSSVALEEWT